MWSVCSQRRQAVKYTLILLVPLSFFCLVTLVAESKMTGASAQSLLNQANQAYDNNDFAAAAETYKRLLDTGAECGEVLYNIGNCYFRMDRLGMALAYYEGARRFMPRNRNLLDNIALTESRTMDRIVTPTFQAVVQRVFFWHYRLTAREISLTVLAANAAFWVSLGFLAVVRRRVVRVVVGVAGVILILSACSYVLRQIDRRGLGRAVVTAEEAQVRTGPGDYAVTFNLHDGTRVKLVDTREGWYQIQLADGKRGWIEAESVERI